MGLNFYAKNPAPLPGLKHGRQSVPDPDLGYAREDPVRGYALREVGGGLRAGAAAAPNRLRPGGDSRSPPRFEAGEAVSPGRGGQNAQAAAREAQKPSFYKNINFEEYSPGESGYFRDGASPGRAAGERQSFPLRDGRYGDARSPLRVRLDSAPAGAGSPRPSFGSPGRAQPRTTMLRSPGGYDSFFADDAAENDRNSLTAFRGSSPAARGAPTRYAPGRASPRADINVSADGGEGSWNSAYLQYLAEKNAGLEAQRAPYYERENEPPFDGGVQRARPRGEDGAFASLSARIDAIAQSYGARGSLKTQPEASRRPDGAFASRFSVAESNRQPGPQTFASKLLSMPQNARAIPSAAEGVPRPPVVDEGNGRFARASSPHVKHSSEAQSSPRRSDENQRDSAIGRRFDSPASNRVEARPTAEGRTSPLRSPAGAEPVRSSGTATKSHTAVETPAQSFSAPKGSNLYADSARAARGVLQNVHRDNGKSPASTGKFAPAGGGRLSPMNSPSAAKLRTGEQFGPASTTNGSRRDLAPYDTTELAKMTEAMYVTPRKGGCYEENNSVAAKNSSKGFEGSVVVISPHSNNGSNVDMRASSAVRKIPFQDLSNHAEKSSTVSKTGKEQTFTSAQRGAGCLKLRSSAVGSSWRRDGRRISFAPSVQVSCFAKYIVGKRRQQFAFTRMPSSQSYTSSLIQSAAMSQQIPGYYTF